MESPFLEAARWGWLNICQIWLACFHPDFGQGTGLHGFMGVNDKQQLCASEIDFGNNTCLS